MKLGGTHSKLTIITGCLDKIASKFTSKIKVNKPTKRVKPTRKNKQVEVIKIPLPILPRLSKETLEKLKFYKKKGNKILLILRVDNHMLKH